METDIQSQAIELIGRIIEMLSTPLTAAERENGWGEPDRLYYQEYFRRLKDQIAEGNGSTPYDLEYINISRSMDDRGISKGEVLHLAAQISNVVRENHMEWSARS